MSVSRRKFIAACSSVGVGGTILPDILLRQNGPITVETIACAEEIAGITLTPDQRADLVEDLQEHINHFASIRELALPNEVQPALLFDPRSSGVSPPSGGQGFTWEPVAVDRPSEDEDLAYMQVAELAFLLKSRAVTSVELTSIYLERLKKYDQILQAVITLTEDLAYQQATHADAELDAGIWRGPLHGVPWGAKDLMSVPRYPTTWGAMPFKDQVLEQNAAVVDRLESAGAVLVAKLSLGALAWGDVWFEGKTKNPWNIEQGSSGSSAGPGAAVAAGLVGFAIGSETLGSIVSPSTRNGVTGFRPTYGLVSRYGAMTLSWSMDKLGPMTRSALDCALVFEAIRGVDSRDPVTVHAPFPFSIEPQMDALRIGYLAQAFESNYSGKDADTQALNVLRDLGGDLIPIELPVDLPIDAMLSTLGIEAAAAFDTLMLDRGVDQMVRQGRGTWPHEFRASRFVPAVEFVQASRCRSILMQRMNDVMKQVDVFVSPTFGGGTLSITNLTGNPCVTVPNGFDPLEDAPNSIRRRPRSITFSGPLYADAHVLELAHAYQSATEFHLQRPPIQ